MCLSCFLVNIPNSYGVRLWNRIVQWSYGEKLIESENLVYAGRDPRPPVRVIP